MLVGSRYVDGACLPESPGFTSCSPWLQASGGLLCQIARDAFDQGVDVSNAVRGEMKLRHSPMLANAGILWNIVA